MHEIIIISMTDSISLPPLTSLSNSGGQETCSQGDGAAEDCRAEGRKDRGNFGDMRVFSKGHQNGK